MGAFQDILDSPANTPTTADTNDDTGISCRIVQPRDGLGERSLQLLDSIREDGKIRDVRISSDSRPFGNNNNHDQISLSDIKGKVESILITRASGTTHLGLGPSRSSGHLH